MRVISLIFFGSISLSYKVGDSFHGFQVKSVQHFKDFECNGIELYHEKSGAKYFHVDSSDTENFFAASFRTIPEDDTGTFLNSH